MIRALVAQSPFPFRASARAAMRAELADVWTSARVAHDVARALGLGRSAALRAYARERDTYARDGTPSARTEARASIAQRYVQPDPPIAVTIGRIPPPRYGPTGRSHAAGGWWHGHVDAPGSTSRRDHDRATARARQCVRAADRAAQAALTIRDRERAYHDARGARARRDARSALRAAQHQSRLLAPRATAIVTIAVAGGGSYDHALAGVPTPSARARGIRTRDPQHLARRGRNVAR